MRVLGFVAGLALFVAIKPAAAAPLGATITVERSERANDCPDAPTLTRQVERILQRSVRAPRIARGRRRFRLGWADFAVAL